MSLATEYRSAIDRIQGSLISLDVSSVELRSTSIRPGVLKIV